MIRTHALVAKTARGIAATVYEDLARDDGFFKLHPNQRIFVRTKWKHFVEPAVKTLGSMLGGDYTETYKAEIYEALLKHWALQGKDVQAIH